jgi:16S rRNA (cytidine1402-2'-O)-methyltransferase
MPGKLVVCPTPIGNLEDITLRTRRALQEADAIACEDTRRTGLLLERIEIEAQHRLVSYHEGNETERARELAQRIERGDNVALVSDAGMPAISDPGYRLIRACIDRDLDLEVLPGPSAILTALVASGLPTHRFRFQGFLPRRTGELERVLQATETLIAFESPRRLPESLSALAQLAPDRPAAVCRELTKLHEEIVRGTAAELAARYAEEGPRGEVVLVIGGAQADEVPLGPALAALRRLVDEGGARPRPAAGVVAELTGTSANALYRALTDTK